jgi:hypothetical protein
MCKLKFLCSLMLYCNFCKVANLVTLKSLSLMGIHMPLVYLYVANYQIMVLQK